VLVPDVGKERDADEIARRVRGKVAVMPEGWGHNSDVNDLALREGDDVLRLLLSRAAPPAIESPFSVAFADQLPKLFTAPDELVQGVLTSEGSSLLFGASNSGKTFLAIDMACAIARGTPWMGRHTESGLVVYLAAESPASVRSRLQAYKKHHAANLPNFAIVQSPIDLFSGDGDTDAVIDLIRQLEAQRGQPVRLIVGDTLARLSPGGNENTGQDMGLVVRRVDRIRTECKAHVMLVHHSGKAVGAGARGWSGIRAAVDTEIEVTDTPTGRCAEITKQRDLDSKGERIGIALEKIALGQTKWLKPATSCVVVQADLPTARPCKRVSEVSMAILELLRTRERGMKKVDIKEYFDSMYSSSSVYRELKRLVKEGQVLQEGVFMKAVIGGGAEGAD
jgi:RecA-family ATPase